MMRGFVLCALGIFFSSTAYTQQYRLLQTYAPPNFFEEFIFLSDHPQVSFVQWNGQNRRSVSNFSRRLPFWSASLLSLRYIHPEYSAPLLPGLALIPSATSSSITPPFSRQKASTKAIPNARSLKVLPTFEANCITKSGRRGPFCCGHPSNNPISRHHHSLVPHSLAYPFKETSPYSSIPVSATSHYQIPSSLFLGFHPACRMPKARPLHFHMWSDVPVPEVLGVGPAGPRYTVLKQPYITTPPLFRSLPTSPVVTKTVAPAFSMTPELPVTPVVDHPSYSSNPASSSRLREILVAQEHPVVPVEWIAPGHTVFPREIQS
ncbi:hypothetical protein K504DRAFT_535380 [Pleomassaria siparia CBS 279.74]|uniref:Ig-like domain-containing protein n=1 Tax=Pleomassaria siparia CBS 279.74 TaxID=1314801 RepID=A0A6G1K4M1_9PLEO|nr:hypothetical protein K504DRAFT_535380 [Pleomassaria siparia CBS 279.74]